MTIYSRGVRFFIFEKYPQMTSKIFYNLMLEFFVQGNIVLGMIPGGFGKSKLSELEVQTSAAFQELGFVIGVAIVVALLFLLLVEI